MEAQCLLLRPALSGFGMVHVTSQAVCQWSSTAGKLSNVVKCERLMCVKLFLRHSRHCEPMLIKSLRPINITIVTIIIIILYHCCYYVILVISALDLKLEKNRIAFDVTLTF